MLDSIKRDSLLTNNLFYVMLNGVLFSFSKVTNIESSIEVEHIVEGGNNDYVHTLRKPMQQSSILRLEKGLSLTEIAVSTFTAGTRLTNGVIILVMHTELIPGAAYYTSDGTVVKWELGNLDAMGNEIVVKKLEIAHTGIKEMAL